MAQLKTLALRKQQAKSELKAFKALLDGKGQGDLSQASDLLPFFDANEHLCALMGMYNPKIVDYKNVCIAREFSIFGDHKADLVIGDTKNKELCFIEFEDAKGTSIFKIAGTKATPDWSTRYDHGFSQLIDWILWIENNKGTTAYAGRFHAASIQFNMLLVIGRDRDLADPALREKFDWRSDSVVVASKKVHHLRQALRRPIDKTKNLRWLSAEFGLGATRHGTPSIATVFQAECSCRIMLRARRSTMIDKMTRDTLRVSTEGIAGPYLMVPGLSSMRSSPCSTAIRLVTGFMLTRSHWTTNRRSPRSISADREKRPGFSKSSMRLADGRARSHSLVRCHTRPGRLRCETRG